VPIVGGPYVQLAAFCENVVVDKQDVLTLVRVVDLITLQLAGPGVPQVMPMVVHQLKLVVSLRSGTARGRHSVRVDMQAPDGGVRRGPEYSMLFEADHRGGALITDVQLEVEFEGTYWFDVRCDEQLLTRIPLHIVYQRVSTGPDRGPAAPAPS
jgi:hypothetical protein